MQVRLNASLIEHNESLFLKGKKVFRVPDSLMSPKLQKMLTDLSNGLYFKELEAYMEDDHCYHLFVLMKERSLLNYVSTKYNHTSLEKSYDFFSYHMGYGKQPFEFKKDIHVAIVGCGGTGVNIAMCLATSGVSKLSLIDFDTVQASNLNRQFAYDMRDIDKSKTKALQQKLYRLNPSLKIKTFTQQVNGSEDLSCWLPKINFLVSAIDRPAIKASTYTVNFALRNNVPIILGAAEYESISAGPLLTTPEACRTYLKALDGFSNVNTQPINGSLASTNLMLSSMLANNITAWFYPFSPIPLVNKRIVYDPITLDILGETYYDDH